MSNLTLSRIVMIWRSFRDVLGKNDLDLISAGVAFYGMFSIFPAFAASIAMFGIVADPVVIAEQLDLLRDVIPADVFTLFEAQIDRLLGAGATTLGWASFVSLAIALWSARAGVGAMLRGLNAIYSGQTRSGVRHAVTAFVMTVAMIGVALIALIVVVAAPIAIAFVPLANEWSGLIELIRWAVALFVLLAALGILYRYAPNASPRSRWLTVGAFVAVCLWYLVSIAFSVYIANFGNYNQVYGSLGAVVALLMWFYLSAYLVLLGGALNVAIARTYP
ncbi:YihY/virulence factor BrkB family protein [Marivivens donghaensis]|jgi:membrane protein|uniref:YihY/virulence factor BrkB family protein n=1 Tax=Marivivens donghaensis TaxID=1699413 RepID=UPI003F699BB7